MVIVDLCVYLMTRDVHCDVFVAVVGRGPADGGGNWLKSALALACMAGTQISSPYDVFTHALQHLVHNKTASNFNERRYYYYVTLNELAVYRSNMPAEVKGSLNIQPGKTDGTGWFFWATTDIPGQLVQRRVACACRACYNNDFDRCSEKDGDMLQGTWFNEPRINVLTVSDETQGKSLKQCRKHAKALQRDEVVAIRAGEINEREDLNDPDAVGLVDVEGSDSDYWLAVVVEGHQTVQEGAGVTVEGKELEYKDEYIVVQWLELLEGGNGREYFLSDERECIWELTALMPVKKLGRYPIPSDMQNAHRPRKPCELATLSKNLLDALV